MNLLIVLMSLLMACNSDETEIDDMIQDPQEPVVSYTTLLAGEESKTWKVLKASSDNDPDKEESCKSNSPRSLDNSYTFFPTGKLEYSFGEIYSSEGGDCKDPAGDIVGEWFFSEDSTKLNIKILHFKNDPNNTFKDDPSALTILLLNSDSLVTKEPQYDGSFNEVTYVKR